MSMVTSHVPSFLSINYCGGIWKPAGAIEGDITNIWKTRLHNYEFYVRYHVHYSDNRRQDFVASRYPINAQSHPRILE